MPRQAADGTMRAAITIRTASDLRDQLERSAKTNNRTLGQEAEARLTKSFSEQSVLNEATWSDATRNVARIVGLVLNNIDAIDGRPWCDTIEGLEAAQAGVAAALDLPVAGGAKRKTSPKDLHRATALKDLAVALGRHLNFTAQSSALSETADRVGEALEGLGGSNSTQRKTRKNI